MKRLGFTMIELVFIIVIMGILATVAIPKLAASRDDACYAKLRTNLSEAQSDLSREYTKLFMRGETMKDATLENILKNTLGADASNGCGFTINGKNIVMKVGKKTLQMTMGTDTLTKSPEVSCNLSDEMCKRLMGKSQ